ncbi:MULTISPECIES: YlcI/YnfO family protein [Paraburkholderia]|uniref:YlcI/YnfO family protein n=1 Tax=Paraburkholderia TaxID=1822464 RepID=UPI0022509CA1|nr:MULTISPECIES: YlcI/YnfO family protein [Paraburkholderia]MCX4165399.1 prevent-host-death protein [Paraburkholderia megapolitana]MDN7160891.1 prevent-host-death protein [Paraburkholderia sp. CHISQ3]MDQ6497938.1 prevent-host-death protein [Paraburkholderia megapolitana]
MKSARFPSIRVEPELRDAAESILGEGETLSGFVEQSVREGIERRRTQSEFIARRIASREAARHTGDYVAASEVLNTLNRRLDTLRDTKQKPR